MAKLGTVYTIIGCSYCL